MKLTRLSILMLIAIFLTVSCKKDDNPTSNETEATSLGVYKGVLVGSSGYFTADLKSGNSTATIVFDGETYQLQSSEVLTDGEAIEDLILSNGGIIIKISVDANGDNPEVFVSIPNHTVYATVYKETLQNSVQIYEGSSVSTETPSNKRIESTINVSISGSSFTMIEKETYSDWTSDELGVAYKYKGTVTRTGSKVTLKTTMANDGDATPLENIPEAEQTSLVFTVNGDKLNWEEEGSSYTESIELTKKL